MWNPTAPRTVIASSLPRLANDAENFVCSIYITKNPPTITYRKGLSNVATILQTWRPPERIVKHILPDSRLLTWWYSECPHFRLPRLFQISATAELSLGLPCRCQIASGHACCQLVRRGMALACWIPSHTSDSEPSQTKKWLLSHDQNTAV